MEIPLKMQGLGVDAKFYTQEHYLLEVGAILRTGDHQMLCWMILQEANLANLHTDGDLGL